jgi:hypothetical protein
MPSRSSKSRISQRRGDQFEQVVVQHLLYHGCKLVERIATPTKVFRGRTIRTKAVSGDIKAILPPNGKAVHVECKYRPGRPVRFSDLELHQVRALDEADAAGAIGVLAVFDANQTHLLNWYCLRLREFGPGKSIQHHWLGQCPAFPPLRDTPPDLDRCEL